MSQSHAEELERAMEASGFNADVEAAKKITGRPFVPRDDSWWKEVEEMTEQALAMRHRLTKSAGRGK